MWSKILKYTDNLLQYEDNTTYENCDNFIASRDYDRTITAVIQSKQYHESLNEEVRRGEKEDNPKICFMSSAKVNHEALREIYPAINIGCFIKKPVSPDQLVRIIKTELE